jgi:2-oxoglutarate dehydrogenase E2 component (dihydrolipoamide succinyltransferase)
MATTPVIIPDLGEIVQAVRIVRWLKQAGEPVELDEELVELTTDKIDVVLHSPATGRVVDVFVPEGARAPVGAVLATIETS